MTLFALFLTYAVLGAIFGIFRIGKVYKSPLPEEVDELIIDNEEENEEDNEFF